MVLIFLKHEQEEQISLILKLMMLLMLKVLMDFQKLFQPMNLMKLLKNPISLRKEYIQRQVKMHLMRIEISFIMASGMLIALLEVLHMERGCMVLIILALKSQNK